MTQPLLDNEFQGSGEIKMNTSYLGARRGSLERIGFKEHKIELLVSDGASYRADEDFRKIRFQAHVLKSDDPNCKVGSRVVFGFGIGGKAKVGLVAEGRKCLSKLEMRWRRKAFTAARISSPRVISE